MCKIRRNLTGAFAVFLGYDQAVFDFVTIGSFNSTIVVPFKKSRDAGPAWRSGVAATKYLTKIC